LSIDRFLDSLENVFKNDTSIGEMTKLTENIKLSTTDNTNDSQSDRKSDITNFNNNNTSNGSFIHKEFDPLKSDDQHQETNVQQQSFNGLQSNVQQQLSKSPVLNQQPQQQYNSQYSTGSNQSGTPINFDQQHQQQQLQSRSNQAPIQPFYQQQQVGNQYQPQIQPQIQPQVQQQSQPQTQTQPSMQIPHKYPAYPTLPVIKLFFVV
jgi:hypothetical protein